MPFRRIILHENGAIEFIQWLLLSSFDWVQRAEVKFGESGGAIGLCYMHITRKSRPPFEDRLFKN
jgi:hypothetical protein